MSLKPGTDKKFDITTAQCNVKLLQIGRTYDVLVIRGALVVSCLISQRVYCDRNLGLRFLENSTYILGVCVLCSVIRKMNLCFGLNELEEINLFEDEAQTDLFKDPVRTAL